MIEITGRVNHIEKGEISSPGLPRPNKKGIPVLKIRIFTASGKLIQVLYKGDYSGYAGLNDEITVEGEEKDGIVRAVNIFNKTSNSWVAKSSGCLNCFIATAVYGSPFSSEVVHLRMFRDYLIKRNKYGEKIVEVYYKISPYVAKIIIKCPILRVFLRKIFFQPFVHILKTNLRIRGFERIQ